MALDKEEKFEKNLAAYLQIVRKALKEDSCGTIELSVYKGGITGFAFRETWKPPYK